MDRQILRDVVQRVRMLLARCVLTAIKDDQGLQVVQVRLLHDERKDGVERVQQYGLSSVPLAEAEGVMLFVGGNRDHGLLISVDDRRYRPRNGAPGDSALYHYRDDPAAAAEDALHRLTLTERDGKRVALWRADELEIKCGRSRLFMNDEMIRMETPDFEATQS